jgi:hypothetical protein
VRRSAAIRLGQRLNAVDKKAIILL